MQKSIPIALAVAALAWSPNAFAQTTESAPNVETTEANPDAKPTEDKCGSKPKFGCFGGWQWGGAISLAMDFPGKERIAKAEVVNGLVRVTDEDDADARLLLELHNFIPFGKDSEWGIGPFVAIQPGSDEIIESVGLGVMIGRRLFKDKESSFNIGIGAIVDPSAQVFGDGVVANEPLPAGETTIRYKEESQWGLLILTSFTF